MDGWCAWPLPLSTIPSLHSSGIVLVRYETEYYLLFHLHTHIFIIHTIYSAYIYTYRNFRWLWHQTVVNKEPKIRFHSRVNVSVRFFVPRRTWLRIENTRWNWVRREKSLRKVFLRVLSRSTAACCSKCEKHKRIGESMGATADSVFTSYPSLFR